MRSRVRGWRWRRGPLRRRSDVVESWVMPAVAVLLFVGAPLVGLATAVWAHDEARHMVREQRADRRSVRAEVVGKASGTLPVAESGRHPAAKVTVRWTEPGEAPRTAAVRVPAGTRTGETVDVWLDSRGRTVGPPPGGAAVWQNTVIIGVCATGGAIAAILAGHGVVRRAAMRRRLDEWERAWARTEPQWTGRRA
ncbi:Rv1733c family protein [Streptomyces sp. NPDC001920]